MARGAGTVTFTRLVLILGAGLLLTDYKFGNGHLLQSASVQTAELGYRLNDTFSQILRRIAPYH
jgi:hypothetical protein